MRETMTDLTNIQVRSDRGGELIPLSSVVQIEETSGAVQLARFNRLRAIEISADLADGYTMGEAVKWFQDTVARELPAEATLDVGRRIGRVHAHRPAAVLHVPASRSPSCSWCSRRSSRASCIR